MKKLLMTCVLTLAFLIVPNKKADAAIILGAPTASFIALGVAGVSWLGVEYSFATNNPSLRDKFIAVYKTSFFIVVLDNKTQSIAESLANKFPKLPYYALEEAAMVISKKAKHIESEKKGLKVITLSSSEFEYIDSLVPADVDLKTRDALKQVLTTEVEVY